MLKGLIGKKIGMTQIFDDNGAAIPVTIIEAGPCYVTQICTPEAEGYSCQRFCGNRTGQGGSKTWSRGIHQETLRNGKNWYSYS